MLDATTRGVVPRETSSTARQGRPVRPTPPSRPCDRATLCVSIGCSSCARAGSSNAAAAACPRARGRARRTGCRARSRVPGDRRCKRGREVAPSSSSESSTPGRYEPAARNAPAAVPGTWAGIHSRSMWSSCVGSVAIDGSMAAHSHSHVSVAAVDRHSTYSEVRATRGHGDGRVAADHGSGAVSGR